MPEEPSDSEPWVVEDVLPIAAAHAEAAAKAAGLSVGEWLARLIAASAPPLQGSNPEEPGSSPHGASES